MPNFLFWCKGIGKGEKFFLLSASSARSLLILDYGKQCLIIKFDPVDRVSQVAFSSDGPWLAAGSWNFQVQLQDMNNLAKEPDLLARHRGRVFSVEFSPDNQWLATSSDDNTIRLWNPTDSMHPLCYVDVTLVLVL